VTLGIAAVVQYQLESAAGSGYDLADPGLTEYLFDVLYITWAIQIIAALVTDKAYWFYMVVCFKATLRNIIKC
jgi:hypothetical protein